MDENGGSIRAKDFQERWRDKKNNLARWDYVKQDSSRIAKLFKPVYAIFNLDYPRFQKKLEEITGRNFPEDQIFLLEYTFLNDICAIDSSNKWTKQKVNTRKRFTNINKEKIEEIPGL